MEIELHPFQSWNLCSVWYTSYNPFMKTSKTKSFVFKLTLWCLLNLLNFLTPVKHSQWLFRMFTEFNIATLNSTHSSLNKWHTLNSFFKVYIHTHSFSSFSDDRFPISLLCFSDCGQLNPWNLWNLSGVVLWQARSIAWQWPSIYQRSDVNFDKNDFQILSIVSGESQRIFYFFY